MYSRNVGKSGNPIYTASQVERALRAAGIRIDSEIATHFIVFCEYHSNHNTPSAEVDKETGQFYCFSCRSTTDLLHLIMKRGFNEFRAMRMIGDSDYNIVDEVEKIFEEPKIVPFEQAVIDRLHSNVWGRGSTYLNSRFITDESIDVFEFGYSSKQDMVTWPIHSPDGTLMGFVGRSVDGKDFKNNRGLQKSQTLFNVHRVWTSSRVFVLESSFDAVRMHQVGMPAVATLGSGISRTQLDILKRTFDEIILIPDNDSAGEIMENKVLKAIPYATILRVEGAHDVGDLSDAELTNFS